MAGPYYVDVTTGDDGDSGLTEALAFATLSFAADTVNDGELVYVKGSASYTAQDGANDCVLYIDDAGDANSGIRWEGYTTTPGDNGLFTIDCQDTLANGINFALGNCYNTIKNCRVTQATGDGIYSAEGDSGILWNVRSDNNGGAGINVDNYWLLINVQVDNNTTLGIDCDANCHLVNPIAHTNGSTGIYVGNGVVINPLVYNNGDAADEGGIRLDSDLAVIYGGSVDCDSNATALGIWASTTLGQFAIVNTILFDCGTGVSMSGSNNYGVVAMNNLFYLNDTARTNWPTGDDEVAGSSDPFTASATRDYTLKSGSEAIDAGIDASGTLDIFD